MTTSVFSPSEVSLALGGAIVVEVALVALLMVAGAGTALSSQDVAPPPDVPIEVTPVIEDMPLLKLGSKSESQLPDMWRKPTPKKRYEDKSAPSTKADKDVPEELPTNELAKSDETPAPEDAELAKKVDEDILEDPEPEDAPNLAEEGESDGVVGGTETDPLKAFVIDQYKAKLIAWFKRGFSAPQGQEYCDLFVRVSANVSADRTVMSFTMVPSGNANFDAKVRAHMDGKVGKQLPPPPPKYPELSESIVRPKFGGENSACKKGSSKTPSSTNEGSADDESRAPENEPPNNAPSEPSPSPDAPSLEPPEDL